MPSELIACGDESYSDARTFIVAGYVVRKANWRKLELAWRNILRRFGIKEFHAVDCTQRAQGVRRLGASTTRIASTGS